MLVEPNEEERWVAGTKVVLLRRIRRWNQTQLAEASGTDKSQVSRYEAGIDLPREQALERFADAADVPFALLDFMDPFLRALWRAGDGGPPGPGVEVRLGPQEMLSGFPAIVDRATALVQAELTLASPSSGSPEHCSDQVEALWAQLKQYGPRTQRLLVEGAEAYRNWRLCVRICTESERRAADDPLKAIEVAELALFVAEHVPGPPAWRLCLQGYVWIFIGNAQRVASRLSAAERAIARGWQLWNAGEDPTERLDVGYLLDLEASFRRDQRRFAEALELHDRALQKARREATAAILLNKAFTLQEAGKSEEALRVLAEAGRHLDQQRNPRLFCVLRFNQAVILLRTGRASEAAPLVSEVRILAASSGKSLDLIRLRWLEGELAAAREEWEEALAALREARSSFLECGLFYDCALVSLDLALHYGKLNRFSDVRNLASEILAIFKKQGIGREALATMILFKDVAEKEAITAEVVASLRERLLKARRAG